MHNLNIPIKRSDKFIENFFKKRDLKILIELAKNKENKTNKLKFNEPYAPELNKLYYLYQYILINKRTTIFEFGSGWSTLIFSLALKELKDNYSDHVKKLRRGNTFELFVLENEKKYLNISRNRIKKFNKYLKIKNPIKINFYLTDVEMTTYNDVICTQYKNLPLCNPDFIYIDGPDQFNIKKNINGINTKHIDMMPMISDILKLEYFYLPGTIIIIDGREANVRFLKAFLKRNWKFSKNSKNDQNIFYLQEKSIGKYTNLNLEFYKKK